MALRDTSIHVPPSYEACPDIFGSVDPHSGALCLYAPDVCQLLSRAKMAGQAIVPLGVFGASVHFRPHEHPIQTTTNGGARSVFGMPRTSSPTISCRVYFDHPAQAWYLQEVLPPSVDMLSPPPPTNTGITTHVGILADVSGSMQPLYRTVIDSALAQFVRPQRHLVTHPVRFFGGTFANDLQILFDGIDLRQHTDAQLCERFHAVRPSGATAMCDAVQEFVPRMEAGASPGDEFVLCIVTDGVDNCSRRCTAAEMRALVDAKKARGWRIIMLGTDDIDVQHLGEKQGIGRAAALTMGRTADDTDAAFRHVCAGLQRVRLGHDADVQFTDDERCGAHRGGTATS